MHSTDLNYPKPRLRPLNITNLVRKILQPTDDDELSKYVLALDLYTLAVALRFPPRTRAVSKGRTGHNNTPGIISSMRRLAASRLYDYGITSVRKNKKNVPNEITGYVGRGPSAAMLSRFIQSEIFINGMVTPLTKLGDMAGIEREIEGVDADMDDLADLLDIYILAENNIKKRSRDNGIVAAVGTYINCHDLDTGDRTLKNKFSFYKSMSVFFYAKKHQECNHWIYSPPPIYDAAFSETILSTPDLDNFRKIIRVYDTVAMRLNAAFGFGWDTISQSPIPFELKIDEDRRGKYVKFLQTNPKIA